MNSRYFLFFSVLISSVPVSGAQFARRCAQFARQHRESVGIVLVGAYAGYSACGQYIEVQKLQYDHPIIKPEARARIQELCLEQGIELLFLCYDESFANNAMAIPLGLSRGGIVVGPGFGFSKDENKNLDAKGEFLLRHEISHIKNNDNLISVPIYVGSDLAPLAGFVAAKKANRGTCFAFGAGLLAVVIAKGVILPLVRHRVELRADRQACKNLEVIEAGILFMKDQKIIFETYVSGQPWVNPELTLQSNFEMLLNRYYCFASHPHPDKRIDQLERIRSKKLGE